MKLADTYFGLLEHLSPQTKRELIAKLSDSLKGGGKKSTRSLRELFGAFVSEKSADEIIADLRDARNFNRNTESL